MIKELSELLAEVIKKDKRYKQEAYTFVFEALEFTIKQMGKRRHINAQKLLDGSQQNLDIFQS